MQNTYAKKVDADQKAVAGADSGQSGNLETGHIRYY
jgi:hypothetical protein